MPRLIVIESHILYSAHPHGLNYMRGHCKNHLQDQWKGNPTTLDTTIQVPQSVKDTLHWWKSTLLHRTLMDALLAVGSAYDGLLNARQMESPLDISLL